MTLASNSQHVVTYAYDQQGRMVWKEISRKDAKTQSWEVEKTTDVIWDGYNIVQDLTHSQTHTLTNFYIWGLDLSGSLQGAWCSAIDKIKATSAYQEKVEFIKRRLREGTAPSGFINIEFNTPEELRASIHGAQLHYNCEKCVLSLRITDDYNFDKKHMWRELQRDGDLMQYSVFIEMPNDKCDRK